MYEIELKLHCDHLTHEYNRNVRGVMLKFWIPIRYNTFKRWPFFDWIAKQKAISLYSRIKQLFRLGSRSYLTYIWVRQESRSSKVWLALLWEKYADDNFIKFSFKLFWNLRMYHKLRGCNFDHPLWSCVCDRYKMLKEYIQERTFALQLKLESLGKPNFSIFHTLRDFWLICYSLNYLRIKMSPSIARKINKRNVGLQEPMSNQIPYMPRQDSFCQPFGLLQRLSSIVSSFVTRHLVSFI